MAIFNGRSLVEHVKTPGPVIKRILLTQSIQGTESSKVDVKPKRSYVEILHPHLKYCLPVLLKDVSRLTLLLMPRGRCGILNGVGWGLMR